MTENLPGRDEFLELTSPQGVVDVVRVNAETIYVLLRDEVWPGQMKFIRRVAGEWWALDRIVLAVRSDLKGLG